MPIFSLAHTPCPLHMPTRPPTQPHTLLFLSAGKELDFFCLEMTHWASRERLQLGTDPEGWRTHPGAEQTSPACWAVRCLLFLLHSLVGAWFAGMSGGLCLLHALLSVPHTCVPEYAYHRAACRCRCRPVGLEPGRVYLYSLCV